MNIKPIGQKYILSFSLFFLFVFNIHSQYVVPNINNNADILNTIIFIEKLITADRKYDFHDGGIYFKDGKTITGRIKVENESVFLENDSAIYEIPANNLNKVVVNGVGSLIATRKDSTEFHFIDQENGILRKLVYGDIEIYDNYFVVNEYEREMPYNYKKFIRNSETSNIVHLFGGLKALSSVTSDSLYFRNFNDILRNSGYNIDFTIRVTNIFNNKQNLTEYEWRDVIIYKDNKSINGLGYIHPTDIDIPRDNSAYLHFYDGNFKIYDQSEIDSFRLDKSMYYTYYFKYIYKNVFGKKWINNDIEYIVINKFNGINKYMTDYQKKTNDLMILEGKKDNIVKHAKKEKKLLTIYLENNTR